MVASPVEVHENGPRIVNEFPHVVVVEAATAGHPDLPEALLPANMPARVRNIQGRCGLCQSFRTLLCVASGSLHTRPSPASKQSSLDTHEDTWHPRESGDPGPAITHTMMCIVGYSRPDMTANQSACGGGHGAQRGARTGVVCQGPSRLVRLCRE